VILDDLLRGALKLTDLTLGESFPNEGRHYTVDRADDALDQLLHVIGATTGESRFRQGSNPFIGVERRRIGRKVLEVQAVMWSEKLKQGQFFHH
jgi:hypothetical protein